MGSSRDLMHRTVIMIDYGLSRKYVNEDGMATKSFHSSYLLGTVKPKRHEAKWVGSRRYMSLNTHLRVRPRILLVFTLVEGARKT